MSSNSMVAEQQDILVDTANSCNGCQSQMWSDIFVSRGVVPVDVGTSLSTEAQARRAPLADISLAYCHGCGLVWNRLYDSSQIAFKPGYDASLHHSPLVNSFMDGLVRRLIDRFDLYGKDILEVGCGTGHFLRQLCERGGNRGTGIDPTVPREGTETVGSGRVRFIRDFFSNKYSAVDCDFLCSQSVLEVISKPSAFLTNVRDAIRRRGAVAYFEMFNAGRAFENYETWSIHYEQCNYFSLDAFRTLFRRWGFQVLDSGNCEGNDQYIFIEVEATKDEEAPVSFPAIGAGAAAEWNDETESQALLPIPGTLVNFAARHCSQVENWREKLSACRSTDRKVVVWGTGGKGVSFLNSVGQESGIRYAVDSNPTRHGRFIPGSAQQIVSPAFLADYRPDAVILSNRAYDKEIRHQIANIGINPEIWHA
jgi:SAM-dependent methyltransferase